MNTNIKNAIFPGTFSPLHSGHIDIISRASKLFDNVLVAVSKNICKSEIERPEERVEKIVYEIKKNNLTNVSVLINDEMTIDFAKKNKCKYIVRSIRNENDAIYELDFAKSNYWLDNDIEVVLLVARDELKNISSTLIKEIEKVRSEIKG